MTPSALIGPVTAFDSTSNRVFTNVQVSGARPPAGVGIAVHGATYTGTGGVSSPITDNHNNTWLPHIEATPAGSGGNAKVITWICEAVEYLNGDPLDITITPASTPWSHTFAVIVFPTEIAVDKYAGNFSGTASSLTLTTPDLDFDGDFILAQIHVEEYDNANLGVPAGYTSAAIENGWNPGLPYGAAYLPARSGSDPETAVWTADLSNLLLGQIIALRSVAPSAPTITISGFGELPQTYPLTLADATPDPINLLMGNNQIVTLVDGNNVPVIGANAQIQGNAATVTGAQTDSNGQVTVNTARPGTATLVFTYSGNGSEASTLSVPINITALLPNQPAQLKATPHATVLGRIDLVWLDKSGNETGFEIQVAPDAAGVPGTWATLTSPAANVTAYSHTGLGNSVTRWYRIRSVNANGPSIWSNHAKATTKSAPAATPSIAIEQQGVIMADGSSVQMFSVVDENATPVPFAEVEVSRPGFVTAPKKVVNGALPVAPAGVGVAIITVTYLHPTAGPLSDTTVVTVNPA